ncbi:uncharacterized protein TNCV_2722871 [Trichonephila clavipes]|nr:uncharacterized protein TNCV_2722871 [Trichonephila clavipes]
MPGMTEIRRNGTSASQIRKSSEFHVHLSMRHAQGSCNNVSSYKRTHLTLQNCCISTRSVVLDTSFHPCEKFTRYLATGKSCRDLSVTGFGLAIHQNDHQARRRFVEWAQNEIAVVPDFHKRILFSDEAHFWLNGYVNKQNCHIWSEANPQVYVETPLHPEKLTVWCALWAGGILLQKR